MLTLSWLTLIRQPARSALAILGVAAVGALLFDMLLLSRGLVLSFRDLLDRAGFDIRVLATDAPPFSGPLLTDATALSQALGRLPEVESVLQLRLRDAELADADHRRDGQGPCRGRRLQPAWQRRRPAVHRRRPAGPIDVDDGVRCRTCRARSGTMPALVINRNIAQEAGLAPGSRVALRCAGESNPLPPVTFLVSGVVDFPFDDARARTAAGTLRDAATLCGGEDRDEAEMLLVRSRPGLGASTAAAAIHAAFPRLYVVTNEDLVERFSRVEFSYFRQISVVLATVTLFFGFLLIARAADRVGEPAARRDRGAARARVVALAGHGRRADRVGAAGRRRRSCWRCRSAALLSLRLDRILRAMPGVPGRSALLRLRAARAGRCTSRCSPSPSLAAAAYPMRIVATLPIAATLRREVVS